MKLPERIGTFTWEQIHLALGHLRGACSRCASCIVDNPGLGAGVFIELARGRRRSVYGAIILQKERNTGALG